MPGYLGRIRDDNGAAVGTCFQISTDGVLVTAWHVLDVLDAGVEDAIVLVDDLAGDRPTARARVMRVDPVHDLAVLIRAEPLGATITDLLTTDSVPPSTAMVIAGVSDVHDPAHEYMWMSGTGSWMGGTTRATGVRLGRLRSCDVLPGMSGGPVRRLSDDAVAGVISGRYNSGDHWLRDSVWVARTEDLLPLLTGVEYPPVRHSGAKRLDSPHQWWSRTGYIEQVRDIAPGGGVPGMLQDRDAELSRLADFCHGDEGYTWWKAGPWSGKSALLSTFVLNPPADVEIVSFFVTARLASQSDSTAFTEMLIEQLSALVDEQAPRSLPPNRADAYRRTLMRTAAAKLQSEGRRLVLVVDGLDEDRGADAASGLPSIASLLPKVCGDALRIIVTGRPDPPLPADVPADHPLRQIRPHALAASPHAAAIAVRANQELEVLLRGDQLERDLIGLITACGGGLTLNELEELTGTAPYRILGLLRGVFGRTIATRSDLTDEERDQLYLFTHETLRESAIRSLGGELTTFRDRIHRWAERYSSATDGRPAWPEVTPQYLFRGYVRMLGEQGDIDRLFALATDQVRHDRMLGLSGGDAAAFAEIRLCQSHILTAADLAEAGLYQLLLLSHHRRQLEVRNSKLPAKLPAVWAAIGQPTRAEELARSIADPAVRAEALAKVAAAGVVAHGRPWASAVIGTAESMALSIVDPSIRAQAVLDVARAAIALDDPERAARLATTARMLSRATDNSRAAALVHSKVVQMLAAGGNQERASQVARAIDVPTVRSAVLAEMATTALAAGDVTGAAQLIRSDSDYYWRSKALDRVARSAATAGDIVRATQISYHMENRHDQACALAAVVAIAGDEHTTPPLSDAAEWTANAIADPRWRARALVSVAEAAAARDDVDRLKRIIEKIDDIGRSHPLDERVVDRLATALAVAGIYDRAEQVARRISVEPALARALGHVAGAMAAAGEFLEAEQVVRNIPEGVERSRALSLIAKTLTNAHDFERALDFAFRISDLVYRTQAMAYVVTTSAAEGELDRAMRRIDTMTSVFARSRLLRVATEQCAAAGNLPQAEQLMRMVPTAYDRVRASTALGRAAALAGDLTLAEQMLVEISNPAERAWIFASMAESAAAAGDGETAAGLAEQAEQVARTISDRSEESQSLASLVEALATCGDEARAERIAHAIPDAGPRAHALGHLVGRKTAERQYELAEHIAGTMPASTARVQALIGIADAAAAVGNAALAARLENEAGEVASRIASPSDRNKSLSDLIQRSIRSGNLDRAETLTRELTGRRDKWESMTRLIKASVDLGDTDRIERLAGSALESGQRNWALAVLVDAVAGNGDTERASRLAQEIPESAERDRAMATIAEAAIDAGDIPRADQILRDLPNGSHHAKVLTKLLSAAMASRDVALKSRVIDRIERIGRNPRISFAYRELMEDLIARLVAAGDLERAESVVRAADYRYDRRWLSATLIDSLFASGDLKNVERFARSIDDSFLRSDLLKPVIERLVTDGDANNAERIALTVEDSYYRCELLETTVEALISAGNLEQAERIGRSYRGEFEYERQRLLAAVVSALVTAGHVDRAEAVAAGLSAGDRGWAMGTIVRALVDPPRKLRYPGRYATASRSSHLSSLFYTEKPTVIVDDIHRAERIAHRIVDGYDRDAAWERLVTAATEAAASSRQNAARLAGMAERIAEADLDPLLRVQALGNIAIADPAHADMLLAKVEEVAREIPDPSVQATALAEVAEAADPTVFPVAGRLIGMALTLGPWRCSLRALAHVRPQVVADACSTLETP